MHNARHRKEWKHSRKALRDHEGSRSLMRHTCSQFGKPDTLERSTKAARTRADVLQTASVLQSKCAPRSSVLTPWPQIRLWQHKHFARLGMKKSMPVLRRGRCLSRCVSASKLPRWLDSCISLVARSLGNRALTRHTSPRLKLA
jgi:hypothetical protein